MLVCISINGWLKIIEALDNAFHSGVIDFVPEFKINAYCVPPDEEVSNDKIPVYTCVYQGRKMFGFYLFEFRGEL